MTYLLVAVLKPVDGSDIDLENKASIAIPIDDGIDHLKLIEAFKVLSVNWRKSGSDGNHK